MPTIELVQARLRQKPGLVLAHLWSLIPRGLALPDDVWRRRHRAFILLLWAHALGISVFAVGKGYGVSHALLEGSFVAGAAVLASWQRPRRAVRAGFASLGLLTASAELVHLSGGYIEFHFHFFVMVALMALYQHWVPFLLAVGYVVLHHGIVGVLDPTGVYNHPGAWEHPWRWAAVHGFFIAAASIVSLTAWRLNEHQALHDPLTGLANRTLFRDRLLHALARRERQRAALAVLFLDLDDFKNVNDSLGHRAGDELLIEIARRLRYQLRPADTISRLGGDEFAILLEDTGSVSDTVRVAARLLEEMRRPLSIAGAEYTTSASIGIAVAHGDAENADELVHNADMAMYVCKQAGKNRYEIFEPGMHAAAMQRLELERELQRAVEAREFVVHYQPIIDARSGRIAGMEALVRWAHPDRGLVQPHEFIPVAEEIGLIVPIGLLVLESACRQACVWDARYASEPSWTMSVNLSARQLQEPGLADDTARILSGSGFPSGRLVLEVTESAMLGEIGSTIARLEQLKALGVKLAIDDFGTGYSSLSYLRRLPIDILKLDRSFLQGIESESRNFELARAIINLGTTLELRTVAEGGEPRAAAPSDDDRLQSGAGLLLLTAALGRGDGRFPRGSPGCGRLAGEAGAPFPGSAAPGGVDRRQDAVSSRCGRLQRELPSVQWRPWSAAQALVEHARLVVEPVRRGSNRSRRAPSQPCDQWRIPLSRSLGPAFRNDVRAPGTILR